MPTGIPAGEAFIAVVPETKGFSTALRSQVTPQLNAASANAKKTLGGIVKGSGLASIAVTAGWAAAGVAVGKFVADSVAAYKEHQVAVTNLQTVLSRMPQLAGQTTKAFEDQATAIQNLTGYQDEEVLAADTVLARFDLTAQQLHEIMPLIADYARATGQDMPTAAGNIGRALLGNTRALKAVGIEYKATGDRATDLANIQDLLQQKIGGTAEAFGKTAAGQMEIFRAKVDDIQEALGGALVPVLNGVVKALSALLPVIKPLLANIVPLVAAFVGFKAITFLPTLLLQIASGLEAIGAARIANQVLGVSDALGGMLKLMGPGGVSAAVGGLTLIGVTIANVTREARAADEQWKQNLSTLRQVGGASQKGAELQKQLGDQIREQTTRADTFTQRAAHMRQELHAAAGAAGSATTAAYEHAQALKEEASATARLAGITKSTAATVTHAWLQVGASARHASDNVQTLHTQIVALPSGKIVKITLPGLAEVRAQLRGLHSEVEAVAGTYGITFNIRTVGHVPGGPIGRLGSGGVFRAAQGFTFVAGEASYPTPLGTGAEVVTPQGVEPLAASHLQRIADFIAVRLDRRTALPPQAAGPPREIVLRARGRDLVATVRTEELWRR